MKDVLLGLADDVTRGIVVEWLEFADVARLDSAYNNRELSRVSRGLLSSPLTLFDFSQFQKKSEEKIRWAMKRQLHTIEMNSSVPGRCVEFYRPHILPGQTQVPKYHF